MDFIITTKAKNERNEMDYFFDGKQGKNSSRLLYLAK
jgi:hypothetical protein